MGIFNKFFKSKKSNGSESQNFSFDITSRLETIYPYFKQVVKSDRESLGKLPKDINEVDKSKSYKVNMITKPICGDLVCFYVIDNESGYEYIQDKHLHSVNIDENQLYDIAMHNYRKLVSEKMRSQNNKDAVWFLLDGNLEASLLLLDEIWGQVQDLLKEDIIVSVPARDVIFATGVSRTEMIAKYSISAKKIFTTGDHPLSKSWFIRKNNAWEVYQEIE